MNPPGRPKGEFPPGGTARSAKGAAMSLARGRLPGLALMLMLMLLAQAGLAGAVDGVVLDADSGRPIGQAIVVAGDQTQLSDAAGRFSIAAQTRLSVRAAGYRRRVVALPQPSQVADAPVAVALAPVRPKALYLSVYGIGSSELRGAALKLIDETELNALVIDIKGDRGLVPYRSAAVAAAGLLPQSPITVGDMTALMKSLQDRGLYLIARIVVFKDEPLAQAHPEWAVRDAQGHVWKDREGLGWLDPFRREAWERSLALAEEAAQLGFDEVQFDYLRFPDTAGLAFSETPTEVRRTATIEAFLDAAQQRLARHNVFISADIFGYVAWNSNDTHIGQQLETLAQRVDYLSPMLYPSGFSFGIPGHRDPVAAPYEIVHHSLQRARERTALPGVRFRPWLQAFRDYAFDHREFGAHEIRAQIDGAEAQQSNGWMLWNPHNRYDHAGLKPAGPRTAP